MELVDALHKVIEQMCQVAVEQHSKVKWYQFSKKAQLLGAIEVLVIMDGLCHQLKEKYSNQGGKLN